MKLALSGKVEEEIYLIDTLATKKPNEHEVFSNS